MRKFSGQLIAACSLFFFSPCRPPNVVLCLNQVPGVLDLEGGLPPLGLQREWGSVTLRQAAQVPGERFVDVVADLRRKKKVSALISKPTTSTLDQQKTYSVYEHQIVVVHVHFEADLHVVLGVVGNLREDKGG